MRKKKENERDNKENKNKRKLKGIIQTNIIIKIEKISYFIQIN